jgi:hypothetical protein
MRILNMGGDRILVDLLFKHLQIRHDALVFVNQSFKTHKELGLLYTWNSYTHVDVRNSRAIVEVLTDSRPRNIVKGVHMVSGCDSSPAI